MIDNFLTNIFNNSLKSVPIRRKLKLKILTFLSIYYQYSCHLNTLKSKHNKMYDFRVISKTLN